MADSVRQLDDWLTTYAEYTSEQESPALFHFWVGTSVIASALERRTHLNRGHYTLYPNLFIVLIGASARVRKTSAITIGYDIFRETLKDACVVSQKTTPEAIISIFVEGFKKSKVSGGVIVSDELGVLLGGATKSVDLMMLLTKWYDCPNHFEYHTMMRGKEIMDNVFCNMIAGTTPTWLKDSMPPHAVGGGFTSRIVFVYQDKPEKLVAFPEITVEQMEMKRKLIHDLQIIARLTGTFKITKEAKEWFENWYTDVFRPEKSTQLALDGYFGRKHDTLLKVAMCMSASKSNSLIIDEIEMRMALKALNLNEKFLPDTLRLIQMNDVGEEMEKVVRQISRKEKVDFTTITRGLSYCMTTKRVEEVLSDLVAGERVEVFIEGGKRWYKMR